MMRRVWGRHPTRSAFASVQYARRYVQQCGNHSRIEASTETAGWLARTWHETALPSLTLPAGALALTEPSIKLTMPRSTIRAQP